MRSVIARCLAATTIGMINQAAAAQDINTTYADLTASLGYSSHPFPESQHGGGSPFASLSASLTHRWYSERTSTKLTGYWEGSEYFRYRMKNLFAIRGDTTHAVNERLQLSASGALTADYSGQLSTRFLNAVQPGEPAPQPGVNGLPSDAYMYAGHEYRAEGDVGLTWRSSERSQILASFGASRVKLSQTGLRDHTTENLSVGYLRSVSEETDVAAHLGVDATQFDGSDDAAIIINPAATIKSHLSPEWTVSGSAGMSFSRVHHAGVDLHSTEPSFRGSLCHENETEHLCFSADHYTHSSAVAELITATTAGIDWIKKLDPTQTVQLSAEYLHFSNARAQVAPIQSTQYRAAATYSRLIRERFSVGVEAAARGYAATSPGHHSDVTASVFLRYRWGNLQ